MEEDATLQAQSGALDDRAVALENDRADCDFQMYEVELGCGTSW